MAKLSRTVIAQLATTAGFAGSTVDTMVAIAFAESGGDPNAHNSTPPDDSYGLWQINMLGSMGPARRKQFGISSNDKLFDPLTNARAAHTIYGSQGLKAWSTYTNGSYKKFLTADPTAATNAADTSTDQYSGISGAIESVGRNLFKGLADTIGIVLAVALLLIGFIILMLQSSGGKKIVNTVKAKVIP